MSSLTNQPSTLSLVAFLYYETETSPTHTQTMLSRLERSIHCYGVCGDVGSTPTTDTFHLKGVWIVIGDRDSIENEPITADLK